MDQSKSRQNQSIDKGLRGQLTFDPLLRLFEVRACGLDLLPQLQDGDILLLAGGPAPLERCAYRSVVSSPTHRGWVP
jgi:hypothetical protein